MKRMKGRLKAWEIFLLAGALALVGGCTTNSVKFGERITDADTGDVSETTFSQTARVTWGSSLEEGAGNMSYTGADWALAVGNTANQAKAGDGVEALRVLVSLGALLAPFAQPAPADAASADGAPNASLSDQLAQWLNLLRGVTGSANRPDEGGD